MSAAPASSRSRPRSGRTELLLLALYVAVAATYFVARYGFQWVEGDSSSMTIVTETVLRSGRVYPPGGVPVYAYGFAYQALNTFFISAAGISLHSLQSTIWPPLGGLMLVAALFILYREISEDARTAALAVLLVLFQGDAVFVTLRSSHEKLDWPLMAVALFLLCRSVRRSTRLLPVHVALFYLVMFAVAATNVFFASVLAFATQSALLLSATARALPSGRLTGAANVTRLILVGVAIGVMIYFFMFYTYPPAGYALSQLRTVPDRVRALFLEAEAAGQPYAYTGSSWLSPSVYLVLTAFTWLLIALSMLEWLRRGLAMLRGQEVIGIRQSIDWLLYGGFAAQIALSVVMDFAGAFSQNLQIRVFPGFTVLAALLLARAVRRVLASGRLAAWARPALGALILLLATWFAVAAVLKATNEPLVSNNWAFYTRSELAAISWVHGHIGQGCIWTGPDGRLFQVLRFWQADQLPSGRTYTQSVAGTQCASVLLAERDRLRAVRMGVSTPSVLGWNRTYDAGDSSVYRRLPRTPYER